MNINLQSFYEKTNLSLSEKFFPLLSNQQKKIATVVSLILGSLALTMGYLITYYWNKPKLFNHSSQNFKNSKLKLLKKFSLPPIVGQPIKGLNLVGICKNENCKIYNKLAMIPRGVGNFDISSECCKGHCYSCQSKIDFDNINTIVLHSCKFQFDGLPSEEKRIQGVFKLSKKNLRLDISQWQYIDVKIEN